MRPTTDKPLSVAMVTTSYPRHAGDYAGHFVAALATRIAEQGDRVTVVAPHAPGAPESEEMDGVSVKRFRYGPDDAERVAYGGGIPANIARDPRARWGLPRFVRALRRAVREHASDADLVHFHWAPTAGLAASALPAGIPTVLTMHGSDVAGARAGGISRILARRAVRRADHVIVVAEEQGALVRELSGTTQVPVTALPNGVAPELLDRQAGYGSGPVLFVGRMLREKGIGELLEAFAGLPGDVRLAYAGDGPEAGWLKERAAQMGLSERVDFHGRVSHQEAIDLIAGCAVLALPSHAEGCPLTVLEAMALARPVVASSVGALPQLLGPESLVEVGDVDGLRGRLATLLSDPSTASQSGGAGRALIAECCTWPIIAKRTSDLYDETLSRVLSA